YLAQGSMQQVGRRVVAANRLAAPLIDTRLDPVADLELPIGESADMRIGAAELLSVGHLETRIGPDQHSGVTDLAAAFGVERSVLQDDLPFLTSAQHIDALRTAQQRNDSGGVGM